jgi:flagellar basal-body rod protein FlgB
MRSIHLFDLASQHNNWLSLRQTVLANNIANANTPGYRALDIEPFEEVMQSTKLQMSVTQLGHMEPDATASTPSTEVEGEKSWDVYHSGSNVSLEQEMVKAGDVNRAYSMNMGVVKAFHRMLLATARPGG